MLTIIGQDIISGNMGYIGTEPGRLYRMGPQGKVAEASGEPPVVLADCKKKPLKGLTIYGKSVQKTTTGAQLLDPSKKTVDGWNIKFDISLEKSKTYTFTNGDKAANFVGLFGVNPGEMDELLSNEYLPPKGSYTFTCAKDYATILLGGSDGKTVIDGEYMLNAGSAPLPWEPYTGGRPSPSPDYPQGIESVGMKWSTGENLLDISQWNVYNITYGLTMMIDEDGYFQLEGIFDNRAGAGNIGKCMFRFMWTTTGTIFPDGVRIAAKMLEMSENVSGLYFLCTGLSETNPSLIISFSAVNGENIKIRFRPMLYVGDTAPEWEPYTGGVPKPYGDKIGVTVGNGVDESQSMSISTPNGLPGIPVASGGNYTDADGQQWVCDEVDFARGVYVQRITKKRLTSTGKYALSPTKFSNKTRIIINDISANTVLPVKTADAIGAVMTDFLFAKSANGTYLCEEGISVEITGHITFYIESIQTIEQAQEYFKDNPTTLHYALTTPIETPLTSDQLAAYKALRTYKGTTIIDNDAGAYMSVKYNT